MTAAPEKHAAVQAWPIGHAARTRHRFATAAGVLFLIAALLPGAARAAIDAVDDRGQALHLAAPVQRAVSLAPHITELVFAAGAGRQLVGRDAGSNYPPEAAAIPSVGEGFQPNAERVATLAPDLILGWQSAPANRLLQVLGAGAPPVYASDPITMRAIPKAIRDMGVLFGTSNVADAHAAALGQQLDRLEQTYAQRTPVRVFIAVAEAPIYTLNGSSIVSDALRLCGGVNVFAGLPTAAAQLSREALLASDIDAIVTGVAGDADASTKLQFWQRLGLPAARHGRLIAIDADLLYRPGPRLVDATAKLCAALDGVRNAKD
jgi:iron complex transport system substrate-binding protein/vitamin B12 transport system substrate-binding protein